MKINCFNYSTTCFKNNPTSKDYAYQLLQNPEQAQNKTEKNFIKSFNLNHRDWEDNPYWTHRLKQDTVAARMNGKYHVKLIDFDIPDVLGAVFSIFTAVWSGTMLARDYKGLDKITKNQKILYSILLPLGILSSINAVKYIVTGRYLHERKSKQV